MLHAVKKAYGAYKPSSALHDAEFEELHAQYSVASTHATELGAAVSDARELWSKITQNISNASQALLKAFPEPGCAHELGEVATMAATSWDANVSELWAGKCPVGDADRQLKDLITSMTNCRNEIKKRNDLVSEVDYYRGKFEELSKSSNRKGKDEDRRRHAETCFATKLAEYETVNNRVKYTLTTILNQKEVVFVFAAAALVDFHAMTLAQSSLQQLLPRCRDIIQSQTTSYTSNNTSSAQIPLATGTSPSLSPNGQQSTPYPTKDNVLLDSSTGLPIGHAPPPYPLESQSAASMPEPGPGPTSSVPQYVEALYDFVPEGTDELPMRKGDRIILLEVLDDHWMAGELNGIRGIFPCNYVQRL